MLALNKTELKRPCSDARLCSDSEKKMFWSQHLFWNLLGGTMEQC